MPDQGQGQGQGSPSTRDAKRLSDASVFSVTPSSGRPAARTSRIINGVWRQILVHVETDPAKWERDTARIFVELDFNRDGLIDIAELTKALNALGVRLTPDQIKLFRNELDANMDG